MFGGNITSSWANPQQNPQQQPSAFGQSGFGTTAFGSTPNSFGQNTQQQQQQPAANPMFGNLGGGTSSNAGNTGFGGFGSSSTQNTAGFGAFGSAKPATGFGAFGGGGGGTFGGGGGGAFGQPSTSQTSTTGTGIFGQPSTTTSAFGAGGIFGSKPTSTFGSTASGAQPPHPVITTGTANPLYHPHSDKDGTSNVNLHYQVITCMPVYGGYSVEELRLQDYAQGRKSGGAFGQTAFQPSTGVFGSQPPQQGSQPSAFGSTTTAPSTGFGAFGQNTAPTTTGGAFGGFGSQQQQQQNQQPAQTGFGAFGSQAQPQQQSGGLFGGGTSAFGSTANKPAFGTFGGGGGFGTFGQQQQQQQQPNQQQGSIFGGGQPSTGFGAFGAKPNIFGGTQTTTTQPSGFGAFGNQQQQQQPQGQQTSVFGGGPLFGQQQQQPQQGAQTGPGIFGSSTTQPSTTGIFGGSSLFGTQQQQQPQQQQPSGFGLFGSKTSTPQTGTNIFGQPAANTTTQPSLFGNTPQSTFGGGNNLFGSKLGAPTLGATPSTSQNPGLFSSFGPQTNNFNVTTSLPGAQATLTASISQPIVSSDLPLSSLLPSGPRLINLDQTQPKKKSGFFVDIPTRSPVPRVQLGYTPASSKLRGFNTSVSVTTNGNPFAVSLSLTSGKPGALSISKAIDANGATGPDSFVRSSSPSLGSSTRQSVKKVVLDKKIEPAQLFSKSGSPGLIKGGKVTFSPALSVAIREKDAATAAQPPSQPTTPTPAPRTQRTPNKFTAHTSKESQGDGTDAEALDEGDYYVRPDLPTLKKLGYDELSSFEGLVVGRVGYGEVQFLETVDLTGLPKLGALHGEVIRFEDKECSVYPDSEDADKPAPGSGLNVKARLTLLRCWAVDKATREPVKDPSHPAAVKHLKRLKNMKDTHFEGFDISEGKWTFTVDHF